MRFEPPVNRAALLAIIREQYALAAQALTFIPLGFDGACYLVHCRGGERYILKCWPSLRAGGPDAARLYATLTVTRALHELRLVPRVGYPLQTASGALWTELSAMPVAVYPFLPGQAPPLPLPPALRQELARTFAVIHRATPAVRGLLPARGSFSIPDERTLRRRLVTVERFHGGVRPGLQALRRLLLPRAAEMLAQYERLRELRRVVQRLPGPRVLCHRDLNGNNLLVDAAGRLSVLDWDGAALAPPEHDLWVLAGEDAGPAFTAYRQAGGVRDLHLEQFEFYLLRRYLWDMLARLQRLLQPGAVEADDEELLRGMEAYGFARWATLDVTIRELGDALT